MADLMQQASELLERFQRLEGTPPELVLMSCDRVLEAIAAALRSAPEGFVLVPVQTLESIRDSSTDSSARGFAAGALAARPQGVK